ncbi:hypothetical protein Kpol_1023p31 [Vanderwaltozyma polyspora DSM 70294]|uniref:histone acetyltransferase n=1 Tax=Vanderwaltozyma polyspora (strain ATCC 22028 / DSM 70294 / BCRC 21397 / CBS 2163 / NBRC 10782 / NRRL Y-8283 / UCD 57-17) TaxID=436907 RepID=A7TFQ4_VANPO|nr:uncharacterized protein Kpol_1023p31 [Vanderwaltozyma polyspora DSM 70294]EDO18862.1 hypothetical protein Kpol_1023p31 [Vanderwaltozyma polyspora DSM 70294]
MVEIVEEENLYGILNERNINYVQFGCNKKFQTWYGSTVYFDPDNKLIPDRPNVKNSPRKPLQKNGQYWLDTIYICEYCFKYCDSGEMLCDHDLVCNYKYKAPGRIKYLGPKYCIRRVKGSKHQLFCQCLCLFTKLFLDNKSMYFKIDQYDFYILYEINSTIPMAFFSKDIISYNKNNLACILTLPPYQRRRLGTILMEFSYKLSRSENVISGPETPLSPFGLISYIKFWARIIAYELFDGELSALGKISVTDISLVTGFRLSDIIMTLNYLECLSSSGEILTSIIKDKVQKMSGKITGYIIQDDDLLLDD